MIGIFLGLYTISLFTPFISAYSQYPLYVVKCLGLPITAETFTDHYTVPGTRAYRLNLFTDKFFCTEQEAQAAGFTKYDFGPHIK